MAHQTSRDFHQQGTQVNHIAPKRTVLRKVVGLGLIATGIAGFTIATGGAGGAIAAVGSFAAASHGGAALAGGVSVIAGLRRIVGHFKQVRLRVADRQIQEHVHPVRELGE
ncbi:MAG: hypothetical protein ACP5OR_05090 [Candidatus Dormibacteria bacterium]